MKIKFITSSSWGCENWDNLGLPLTVWINKQDTVQDVIDLHCRKIKKYLIKCYRLKDDGTIGKGKAILIHKHKWDSYRISQRMKLPKDSIVFKLKPRDENNILLPCL